MIGVLLLSFAAPALPTAQEGDSKAYAQIFDLLKTNQVSRVAVIHLPSNIETRTAMNQQALRRLRRVELSFTKPQEGGLLDALQAALGELRAATSSPEHEVRWGILFFDAAGKERAAIFLDSTGRFLQAGEARLQVQGKILACIKKMIHDAFS
jgi:hypothetical protein